MISVVPNSSFTQVVEQLLQTNKTERMEAVAIVGSDERMNDNVLPKARRAVCTFIKKGILTEKSRSTSVATQTTAVNRDKAQRVYLTGSHFPK